MEKIGTLENSLRSIGNGALSFVIAAPLVCGLAYITTLENYGQAIAVSAGVALSRTGKEFYRRLKPESDFSRFSI